MRRRMAVFLVAMLTCGIVTPKLTKAEVNIEVKQIETGTYEEGIVLVKYIDEAPQIEDVTLIENYTFSDYTIGRYHSERYTTKQMISAFNRKSQVIYSEPDYDCEILPITDDTWKEKQSSMEESIQDSGGIHSSRMWIDYAWNQLITTIKDTETVIAVIDTGVDSIHPDLVEHMWMNTTKLPGEHGYDVINGDQKPMDDNGHGTQCAAMIVSEIYNQWENIGSNPNSKIMSLKCMDKNGTGQTSTVVKAYQYMIEAKNQGVNVVAVNNCFGVTEQSKVMEDIIREAGEKGILSIFADDTIVFNDARNKTYFTSYDSPYVIVASPMVVAEATILTQLFPKEETAKIRARIVGSGGETITAKPECIEGQISMQRAINNPYAVIHSLDHTKGQLTLNGYFFGEDEGSVEINGQSTPIIRWNDTSIVVDYGGDFDGYATITLFRGDDLTSTEQKLLLSNIKYQWTDEANLPIELSGMAVAAYQNNIFVFGGTKSDGTVSTKVFCYNTITKEWNEKANLPELQDKSLFSDEIYAATVGNSIILSACDYQFNTFRYYQYSVAEDVWSEMELKVVPELRQNAMLVNYQGSIYMLGGFISDDNKKQQESSKDVWKLSGDFTTWERVATLNEIRSYPIAAEVNKKLVITGGNSIAGDYATTTEVYDGSEVIIGADLPYKGLNNENTVYGGDGALFIMTDGVSFNPAGLNYDVVTNEWTANQYHKGYGKNTDFASTAVNGKLYLIGGLLDNHALKTVQSLSFVPAPDLDPNPTPTIVPIPVEEPNNLNITQNDNEAKGTLWTFVLVAVFVVAILAILVLILGRKNRRK